MVTLLGQLQQLVNKDLGRFKAEIGIRLRVRRFDGTVVLLLLRQDLKFPEITRVQIELNGIRLYLVNKSEGDCGRFLL